MNIYTKSRASCFTHSGQGGQYSACVCVYDELLPMKVCAYCMRVHGLIHSHIFTTEKWIIYRIESKTGKTATLQLKIVNKKRYT